MSEPLILAIDTSCDDTSTAVTAGTKVLSNVIASQTQLHAPYGGVFPTVAKQAHKENINQTIKIALKRAKVTWDKISAIAVTQGPGLAPSLEVGIAKSKELATKHKLPLIAVNHIEAHALSPLANSGVDHQFPALAIVVSGGHTDFIKITQIGEYERLGFSIDDAAGEALDKVGRMLNLGYPAGPIIEQFAKKGDSKKHSVPLPMTGREDFNMSFSGLKTWARNKLEQIETQNTLNKQDTYDFAASFQYGVFRHICYKLNKLLKQHQISEVWLGGGVAANIEIRRMIRETLKSHNIKLFTPYSKRLCMDNAAMIGVVAGFKFEQQQFVKNIKELERRPRWEINT
ncbi:MAG: tRNA (adenosine(37)-N6)-threonylcarbamoyltransferase complex transferase subunit TsaD [Candidatus Pacebacteria bacterium]|jgi:N6-L-threonylcarbamoyladenine synthase|nr:tRNA (adenosine(37)-N6)-threonylcarbamoyltransferase complex transferase subunit TsaD [Candidatus Paceibacterota bacterium]MBT3511611.1 tRNA (adenosine(37)-N6)-threonylcarbamoyltransferase complex transferase subunit TsaD [Candidatus Paceibacterota bacterium]MBT4004700.1 tRNA (adenosine(37)-N6)-threonylcarbamoyltransferase complex transferase subunit TsaD [Candidatus Paceibacterota bacterium]MBT4359238.1 tRNA (adenosine(37)-N6)-threonylcarbamoyltransferase complex transferase subunit TsaD [Ca